MEHPMTHAIILRCPPSRTREIYEKFREERPGAIWAPMLTRIRRLPRQRKRVQVTNAAVPGYLFLAERQDPIGPILADLARLQTKPLWTPQGFFARCPMAELEELRRAVQGVGARLSMEAEPPAVPQFASGTEAQVVASHYWMGDLTGRVVRQDGEEVTLDIADFWGVIKISCWLLRPAGL